ncbi:L-selectin-like [Acanthaster planci]|uniref:L-selectin-like n=1 Tax=Acanthaster planci TaxID=133434 RepID=A0A8B7YYK0_ACAPL|nr:L-selectin-like [Acanthaster planci]
MLRRPLSIVKTAVHLVMICIIVPKFLNMYRCEVFTFLLLVCCIPHIFGGRACPLGWAQHAKTCYTIVTSTQATWSDASDFCRQAGGELALPVTRQETNFLWTMFQALNLSKSGIDPSGGLWIGCRRVGTVWGCTHAPTLQFVRWWDHDQPDGSHDCLLMWRFAAKWADASCEKRRFIACQRRSGERTRRWRCLQLRSGHQQLGCLMNHVLQEVTVVNPLQCCTACYNEPRCRSFNLKGDTCHLNVARHSYPNFNEDTFMAIGNSCAYYEIEID